MHVYADMCCWRQASVVENPDGSAFGLLTAVAQLHTAEAVRLLWWVPVHGRKIGAMGRSVA